MAKTPDGDEFWERVDREMRIKKPRMWSLTKWLLRLGVTTALFAGAYMLFSMLVPPSRGFYWTRYELAVQPIIWALGGATLIILGAYLRFRTMGPIIDHLKRHGID